MIKCVAIDDEPIAISIIEEYCNRYGGIDLKCFTSPVRGMQCIMETRPDIVFLDIEMNSHNGVEMAKSLPAGTCLIFTTAYSGYAIDGFNVDAIDFLHKPIFYSRFEHAMAKAKKFLSYVEEDENEETITVKADRQYMVINLKDIIMMEAMDNYVKIFRKGLPLVISKSTMNEMEELLPVDRFMRVHRSFIVAINSIESFAKRALYIHGYRNPVPVGRKYINVLAHLNNKFNNSNNILQ